MKFRATRKEIMKEIAENNFHWETRKKLLTDLLNSFVQSVKIENGLAKL